MSILYSLYVGFDHSMTPLFCQYLLNSSLNTRRSAHDPDNEFVFTTNKWSLSYYFHNWRHDNDTLDKVNLDLDIDEELLDNLNKTVTVTIVDSK